MQLGHNKFYSFWFALKSNSRFDGAAQKFEHKAHCRAAANVGVVANML